MSGNPQGGNECTLVITAGSWIKSILVLDAVTVHLNGQKSQFVLATDFIIDLVAKRTLKI